MFERVVIGVDPGMGTVGVAVVWAGPGRPQVRWTLTLRNPADAPASIRLRRIHDAVAEAISEHRPEALALERLMWGRNVGSAMDVARASGAVMVAAARAGLTVEEYAPLEVKMAVTGQGNASKDQVRRGLGLIVGPANVPGQADAADAVAVALCHLQQARMRRLVAVGPEVRAGGR